MIYDQGDIDVFYMITKLHSHKDRVLFTPEYIKELFRQTEKEHFIAVKELFDKLHGVQTID